MQKILLIDDLRDFKVPKEGVVVARTVAQAFQILQENPEQQWDEIWFDHDMGEELATPRIMDYMNERAFNDNPVDVKVIYVHTSNNVGGATLMSGFRRYGYPAVRVAASDFFTAE